MEIVALFRDFQENSDLANVKAITDIGDGYIDSRSEWSFGYVVKLRDASLKESFEKNSDKILRDYVRKLYGIDESSSAEDITWADGRIVSTSRMGWGRDYKGGNINFQCYPVAYNFLRFMGIEIVEGRDFSESDEVSESSSMIFNTRAQKEFDIDLETPGPGHQNNTAVVGICKDFNFKPLQYGTAPFAFYIFGKHS